MEAILGCGTWHKEREVTFNKDTTLMRTKTLYQQQQQQKFPIPPKTMAAARIQQSKSKCSGLPCAAEQQLPNAGRRIRNIDQ